MSRQGILIGITPSSTRLSDTEAPAGSGSLRVIWTIRFFSFISYFLLFVWTIRFFLVCIFFYLAGRQGFFLFFLIFYLPGRPGFFSFFLIFFYLPGRQEWRWLRSERGSGTAPRWCCRSRLARDFRLWKKYNLYILWKKGPFHPKLPLTEALVDARGQIVPPS